LKSAAQLAAREAEAAQPFALWVQQVAAAAQ
jgi:hypothetical protein